MAISPAEERYIEAEEDSYAQWEEFVEAHTACKWCKHRGEERPDGLMEACEKVHWRMIEAQEKAGLECSAYITPAWSFDEHCNLFDIDKEHPDFQPDDDYSDHPCFSREDW